MLHLELHFIHGRDAELVHISYKAIVQYEVRCWVLISRARIGDAKVMPNSGYAKFRMPCDICLHQLGTFPFFSFRVFE